ncbi:MAG: chitosanase [Saprospiraceae bacterium]|nr:chitosanase [Saprospiraceae bacterium]
MVLSSEQKSKITSIVNCFETGSKAGDYGLVSIYRDKKNPFTQGEYQYQVTYGRSQTTEQSNLRYLLELYVSKEGLYATEIKGALSTINRTNFKYPTCTQWAKSEIIIGLLKECGKDPIMQVCQDEFFDQIYYKPATDWAKENGFTLPLSMLVIYDSFIHSGKIRDKIRNTFKEVPPAKGGDEKKWITHYIRARHKWLSTHRLVDLRRTVYRTNCFAAQINKGNWNLTDALIANGVLVK